MRSFQANLDKLAARGLRIVAISVDPPETTRDLCQKQGYTYTFLSDPRAEVIRQYDLLHAGGGMGGADIARPAEFLLDSTGTVRWVNLSETFRVRANTEMVMKVLDEQEATPEKTKK